MKSLNSDWINPIAVIKVFSETALLNTKNTEELMQFIKKRPFRRTAEAWIAAAYLLALNVRYEPAKHYLQENSNPNDAPDFFGLSLFIENKIQSGNKKGIEVFRYTSESELSLEKELEKKIKKSYSKDTVLVFQITKSGFKMTLGQIQYLIKNLNPKNEIWVIGGSGGKEVLVSRIYPEINSYKIYIKDYIDYKFLRDYPAFIEADELKYTKEESASLKFENLGKKVELRSDFKLLKDN